MMNLNQSLMVMRGLLNALDHFAAETSGMHKHEEVMKHCEHAALNLTAAVAQLAGMIVRGQL